MSDDDARLTWFDKLMIVACSLALAAIFGTVLLALALIVYWFA